MSASDHETPLTFVVRDWETGDVLDAFSEDELFTYDRAPKKVLQEATAWAVVATAKRRREKRRTSPPTEGGSCHV